MIVKLKKYKPEQWSGVKFYSKENSYTIRPGIDNFGLPNTGLTKEDEERLGKLIGHDLSKQSPFWHTVFGIRVDQDDFVLDTSIPMHELYYKVLLAKKNVAPSIAAAQTMAKVDFVLYNESQEAQISVKARNSKKRAYAKFAAMNPEDMKNYLIAKGRKPYGMTEEVIEDLVGQDVERDPRSFLLIADDSKLNDKVFINELVFSGILERTSHSYKHDGVTLGNNIEEVVEYLNSKENQPVYVNLKKQLVAHKKAK